MIPVEQRHMAIFDENGDNVQRGDCLTACVASDPARLVLKEIHVG